MTQIEEILEFLRPGLFYGLLLLFLMLIVLRAFGKKGLLRFMAAFWLGCLILVLVFLPDGSACRWPACGLFLLNSFSCCLGLKRLRS